ncbi:hypothetical protein [Shewanella fodinae]|uniref:hypothetical protein n=1 Tax=Shewanella fodinae TaxID=552357 RepID=UPI001673BDA0|nr:hypothetical protein [Shewanella fodinae]MCL2908073.1 hypothetical protein [Shewanella fodinae]GGZ13015.1 hypothetical protein GCM10007169_32100 [Shewanella fodinae]
MSLPVIGPVAALPDDPLQLTENLTSFNSLKLICQFKRILSSQLARTVSATASNPVISPTYELRMIAEADNWFENFDVEIFLTFGRERDAWLEYQQRVNILIQSGLAVFVTAEVFSHIEGTICLYNPELTPTNMPFIQED